MEDTFKSLYIHYLKDCNYNVSRRINAIKYLRIIGHDFKSAVNIYDKAIKMANKFSTDIKQIKSNLRMEIRNKRSELDKDTIEEHSKQICLKAAEVLQNNGIKKLALYAPIERKKEINTNYLFDIISNNGIEAYYPDVKGETLSFSLVRDLKDLEIGKLDIPVPKNKDAIPIYEIDAFILPGLSFNPINGARLGYGMGHYDKTLKENKAFKIGVVLSKFLNRELPSEDLDVDVDCIITENDVIWINR